MNLRNNRQIRSIFFSFSIILLSIGKADAQYCNATSLGAGNVYGGNISGLEIRDDSGVIFAYSGIANNTTPLVLNATSSFTLSSWEYFTVSMKGLNDSTGKKWWSKAGVWVDLNRDGDFTADECISNPETGGFKHLNKDTWRVALLNIPGTIVPGKTRIRMRGFDNKHTATAAMGCGVSGAYGNQIDMEINLFVGSMGNKTNRAEDIRIYPNPASTELQIIFGNKPLNADISILNLQGKVVSKNQILKDVSGSISIGNLADGIYIVSIKTEAGIATHKMNVRH